MIARIRKFFRRLFTLPTLSEAASELRRDGLRVCPRCCYVRSACQCWEDC